MLYILPTPIGNLDDITLRCLRAFRELSVFICEDTRETKKLFRLLDIDYSEKHFHSLTSFTGKGKLNHYVNILQAEDVGLVSDAGCPGLSDPGKQLVAHCVAQDLPFSVLPGANALVPAVVSAGFDTSKFQFRGFLPTKKGRQTMMKGIIGSPLPVFVYESVHRVEKTLLQMKDLGFVGKVSVAREVSKMHEQVVTADIDEVLEMVQDKRIVSKGEFVLGFCGA